MFALVLVWSLLAAYVRETIVIVDVLFSGEEVWIISCLLFVKPSLAAYVCGW